MFRETVTSVHHWSDRTFSFCTSRDPAFRFNAGEFVLVGIRHAGKPILRAYSIVSPPWSDELEFLSIKIADGELTSRLQYIKEGDEILIATKTTGTLRNAALIPGANLWLLATGTGLAPFMSLIRDLEILEAWSCIHVIHSVRDSTDLAYQDQLTTAFSTCTETKHLHSIIRPILHYQAIVTGAGDARITAQLASGALAIDCAKDRVMLCGNMAFNREVAAWCEQKGMTEGSLRKPGDFVLEKAFVDT
ncbi:ferredoxin--NADP reductase [Polynucleobacter antarcticus]|uniref:ferredoxin--NADP(+) reductase n=1 Tax=Polynucleobacter antarcticus TaxID=1743162 RepID=A0A6M9PRK0_9BURK|nr:ferredoxin--NADP reductase [Polynucleobacter antarcticus]QKM62148.1 ferredoxin--NADP(+) reductase [Polynucleobacter antarcticus]